MGRYIDGFVLPVAKDRVEEYRRIAEQAALIWKEHGALDYWECVGDDLGGNNVSGDDLCHASFPQIAQAGPEETVIFAWAVFESRAHRDQANEKIMADPRIAELISGHQSLFDFKRMAHGGFAELVHA